MEADTERKEDTGSNKSDKIYVNPLVSVHQTVDRIEPREGSDQSSNV